MASYITYGDTYYGYWKVGTINSNKRDGWLESVESSSEHLSSLVFPDGNYYFFIMTNTDNLGPLPARVIHPVLITDYTQEMVDGETFEIKNNHVGVWFNYNQIWSGTQPATAPENDPPPGSGSGSTPSVATYLLTYKDIKENSSPAAQNPIYETVLSDYYSIYPTNISHNNFNGYIFSGYYTAGGTKSNPGASVSGNDIFYAKYDVVAQEPQATNKITIYPNGTNCSFRLHVGGLWKGIIYTDENGLVGYNTEEKDRNYPTSNIVLNNYGGPHVTFLGLDSQGGYHILLGELNREGYNYRSPETRGLTSAVPDLDQNWCTYKWIGGYENSSISLRWNIKKYNINVTAIIYNGSKSNFTHSNLYGSNPIKLTDLFNFNITNVTNSTPTYTYHVSNSYAYIIATYEAEYGKTVTLTDISLNLSTNFKNKYFTESYISSGHYPIPFVYNGSINLDCFVNQDRAIPLYITLCSVPIYTSNGFKNTIPYIYNNGWKPTIAYIYNNDNFKQSEYKNSLQ